MNNEKRSFHNRGISNAGQATMEFLLFIPMLLLVIAFVVSMGWWVYTQLTATNLEYSQCIWYSRQTFGGLQHFANPSFRDAVDNTQVFWYDETGLPSNGVYNSNPESTRLTSFRCGALMILEEPVWGIGVTSLDTYGVYSSPPFANCDSCP